LLKAALFGACLQGLAQGSRPPELEVAEAFLQQGRADDAWHMLLPLQAQYAGQPDYDLALAVAATDSGRPNLATFALERLVVMQPNNLAARLELVRAYLALHDHERAERELRFILDADPPAEVRALAAQYRARLSGARAAAAAGWTGYAEAGFGYDTNANVSTAQGSVFVPSLGTQLILDRAFVRDPDAFTELAAGAEYAYPLSGTLAVLAGAGLRLRSYRELDAFDSRAADVRIGLNQRLGLHDGIEYTLRHEDYELDHAGYRRMQTAAAEWRRSFGDRARVSIGAQGYRIRYRQEDAQASDSNLLALSAGAAWTLDRARRSVGLVGATAGSDAAVAGRADGDRRIYGAGAGLQHAFAPRVAGYANVAFLASRYRTPNPDFGVRRRDRQLDLSLGASWELAPGWFLRPQLTRTRNGSNIAVHEYRRTEASLSLRREWQ
jgi:hypothetical protein